MAVTQDPNEQNFINPNLAAITNNNADAPKTGRAGRLEAFTPNYVTRTSTNVATGAVENDTALIIN